MKAAPQDIPNGYKKTGIGVLPKDWNVPTLGELGDVIRGSSPRPKGDKRYYGGNVPRLMVEDITRDKHWVRPSVDFLTEEGAKHSRLCKRGTLTVVCSGTPTAVGLPALLAIDACIHDGILALVRTAKRVVPEFLFHQLASEQQRLHAAATHGGTFVNLTTLGFREYRVALPPTLAEQEAIAGALSDADALIDLHEQLLAKKRDIKQGAMQELLAGKRRLPGFSGEWKPKLFAEIAQPRTQRIDPRRTSPLDFCVELEHIEQGTGRLLGSTGTTAASSLKSVFRSGDVLFGKLRAYLRKYWLANVDGVCSTEIWALIPSADQVTPEYLFQIVKTDRFIDVASTAYGTHMPRSDWNVVKNHEVHLPSIAEQTAIATILTDMDAEIATSEAKLAKVRQIKQGMMQELLTGRIRLV